LNYLILTAINTNTKSVFEVIVSPMEKTPTQSKKFIAYMTATLISKLIILYMVHQGSSAALITWAITSAAFLDIGYILGQTALDIFVRMAHIKSNLPTKND